METKIIGIGAADMMNSICSGRASVPKAIKVTATGFCMQLASKPESLEALGGLQRVCEMLVRLIEDGLEDSELNGRGMDVDLVEAAVR